MKNMEIKTRLSIDEMAEKLRSYFGPGGLGLTVTEDTGTCLTFVGGGGYIKVSLCREGSETKVDIATQEFDYAVGQFAQYLP